MIFFSYMSVFVCACLCMCVRIYVYACEYVGLEACVSKYQTHEVHNLHNQTNGWQNKPESEISSNCIGTLSSRMTYELDN